MKHGLLFVLLLSAPAAFAANDGSVTLSPAVIMLRGETGQTATQTVMLHNGTSRTLSFDVVAEDVIVRGGKRGFARAGETRAGIAATAVFSERHITVAPGEKAAVRVTLTVPPNAANRAVVALFRGTDRIMNGKVPMTASLGTLITFALSDQTAMTARPLAIRPQSATSNLLVSRSCVNSGTEPLVARGVLAVLGADGRLVTKAAVPPRRLLPGEEADLGAELGAELGRGRYRLLLTFDYDGRALTESAQVDVP